MNLVKSGQFGLVLDAADPGNAKIAGRSRLFTPDHGDGLCGHFILERYAVDDNGYVCLTPSFPIRDLYASVEILRATLEGLLEQAQKRFPDAPPHLLDSERPAVRD